MLIHYVPTSSNRFPARNAVFVREFATPLNRSPPRLLYAGYKGALKLYGCESGMARNLKSTAARSTAGATARSRTACTERRARWTAQRAGTWRGRSWWRA
ncbi:hypothetical protein S40285_10525 [Stachybotrys chlorohalonatus IBT 40285]|uniref:Uncharacterized protein n=1 Tax=Stachybotrys chlorohalonatus (strain IBT 40285) TaxID=1283841 RepID=A0A084QZN9_STAC4|nr:hypothetical protein S40285_10525 [Stachybotrys chlorohalonata IBT 40285]